MNFKSAIFGTFFVFICLTESSQTLAQTNDIEQTDTILLDQKLSVSNSQKENLAVDEIIQFAKKYIGSPYHYGGSSPSGFDCSGFIFFVMNNFGFPLAKSAPGIAQFGMNVKLSELQAGDLMFFKGRNSNSSSVGHVGMVVSVDSLGIIQFIHSSTSKGVIISQFNASSYYVQRYLRSKRLNLVPSKSGF